MVNIKGLTQFVRTEHLKNYGRASSARHLGHTRQLVHKGILQRCTLQCSNPSRTSDISEFLFRKESIPIHLLPIWPSPSPENIDKGNETST